MKKRNPQNKHTHKQKKERPSMRGIASLIRKTTGICERMEGGEGRGLKKKHEEGVRGECSVL